MKHAILTVFSYALGLLAVLHEGAKDTDFVVLVPQEVEAILLAEAHLQEVVVKALLGDPDPYCGVLERVANELAIPDDAIIQPAPQADLLYNIFNCAFLGTFLRLCEC